LKRRRKKLNLMTNGKIEKRLNVLKFNNNRSLLGHEVMLVKKRFKVFIFLLKGQRKMGR
jgi:hypothetical protein